MNKPFQKIYFDPYLFFSLFLLSTLGLFFLFSASNFFSSENSFLFKGKDLKDKVSVIEFEVASS